MFSDGQIEERGASKTGGSSGVADRENDTTDGDVAAKDTRGGIARRTGHSEEKTGGQYQRPHQAAHARLAVSQAAQIIFFHYFLGWVPNSVLLRVPTKLHWYYRVLFTGYIFRAICFLRKHGWDCGVHL